MADAACKQMLFVGCRNQNKDYLYAEEWERYQMQGRLELLLAFSRDGTEKVYVTHQLKRNGKRVWDWISEKRAVVYLSGYLFY